MRKFAPLALAFAAVLCGPESIASTPVAPGFVTFGHDENSARELFDALKTYYARSDIHKIGDVSNSPLLLTYWEDGRRPGIDGRTVGVRINGLSDLEKYSARIMSDRMRRYVAKMEFASTVASRHGVAFGNGILWADKVCPDDGRKIYGGHDPCRPRAVLRLITVNEPKN